MKRHLSFAATVALIWYVSTFIFKFAWKQLGLPVTEATALVLNVAALPVSVYVGWSSYYKEKD